MRLVIGRKVDLAIRALQYLAETGTRTPSSEIAADIETTVTFLPQIMGPLVAEGWVKSERGPGGGYHIAVDLESVSVLDVITAVEGPMSDSVCVLRGGPCGGADSCSLHDAWRAARTALTQQLAATSLNGHKDLDAIG